MPHFGFAMRYPFRMPTRRTEEMHRGRISLADGIYFTTCCAKNRRPELANSFIGSSLVTTIRAMDKDRDTCTYAFTVMPDHIHWLFELTGRLQLGEVIAKMKFSTRHLLAAGNVSWQRDYYDHRLRRGESIEDYALYTFLNPYRAEIIPCGEVWPFWWSAKPEILRFMGKLGPGGQVPPAWVGEPVSEMLRVGE